MGRSVGTHGAAAGGYRHVLTVPNVVSLLRLLGVPVFLWLFLGSHSDGWAVAVLAVGGTSDWVDGYLARRLGQVSRLGELLDPFVDRLYIVSTLLAFTIREVVPWPFTVALLVREAVLLAGVATLRRYGYGPPPVHYLGKTATFVLLFAFPVLLLAAVSEPASVWAYPVGWALAWWGLVFYWFAGLLYLRQVAAVLRGTRGAASGAGRA